MSRTPKSPFATQPFPTDPPPPTTRDVPFDPTGREGRKRSEYDPDASASSASASLAASSLYSTQATEKQRIPFRKPTATLYTNTVPRVPRRDKDKLDNLARMEARERKEERKEREAERQQERRHAEQLLQRQFKDGFSAIGCSYLLKEFSPTGEPAEDAQHFLQHCLSSMATLNEQLAGLAPALKKAQKKGGGGSPGKSAPRMPAGFGGTDISPPSSPRAAGATALNEEEVDAAVLGCVSAMRRRGLEPPELRLRRAAQAAAQAKDSEERMGRLCGAVAGCAIDAALTSSSGGWEQAIEDEESRAFWVEHVGVRATDSTSLINALCEFLVHEGSLSRADGLIAAHIAIAEADADGDHELTFIEWDAFTRGPKSLLDKICNRGVPHLARGVATAEGEEEELQAFAAYLGIREDEPDLIPVARSCMLAPMPSGWTECFDAASERPYFHHAAQQITSWKHPLDETFFEIVAEQRAASR